jgi:hypothetical protein
MSPDDSFIMFGYGSPISEFVNKSKGVYDMTAIDLKNEVIARARLDPKMHPNLRKLAEHCVINTAYVHMVKNCSAVKPWDSSRVTLIGDAVFK